MECTTFRKMGDFELRNYKQDDPSCFNGMVRVKRYKLIIEEIDEPDEVIVERIKKLWAECDNSRHWSPLQAEARKYGIELDINDAGKDLKK